MAKQESKAKNIFEAVSNIERDRRSKEKSNESTPSNTQEHLDDIFQRCRKMHQEIANSIDQAYQQAGVSRSDVLSYVKKSQNFSPDEWKQVEEGKKQSARLLEELKKQVGIFPPSIPSTDTTTPPSPPSRKELPPKAEPKKKSKIITRRQWIGM